GVGVSPRSHNNGIRLAVLELSQIEALELADSLGAAGTTIERQSDPKSEYGDFAAVAVVFIVTAASLKAVSLWLTQARSRSIARQELEVRYPDGTTERRSFEIRSTASDGVNETVLRALGDFTTLSQPQLPLDQHDQGTSL